MSNQQNMSRTMRIDLIPDIPAQNDGNNRNRVIVKSTTGADATELKQQSKYLTNTPYHELLQGIYDAALITDLEGVISDLNVRAIEFFQWSEEELIGAFVGDVISGVGSELVEMLVNNLEKERHSLIQAYCLRKDESMFPAEIAVNRFRVGNGNLCFFIRDVTVRRQAEEMLRTEHNAIQNAANGIAIVDLDANIEYVNPAFVKMLVYPSPESMVGLNIRQVLGECQATEHMISDVLVKGLNWSEEIAVARAAGGVLDLGVFAACNFNSDGEKVGIVLSLTDLSDKKRAESAMHKAEQQRVMLESLGAACHHLGQPATVLTANMDIIKSRLKTDDKLINDLVDSCIDSLDNLGEKLRKLNSVNEYRTTPYLKKDSDGENESLILDI